MKWLDGAKLDGAKPFFQKVPIKIGIYIAIAIGFIFLIVFNSWGKRVGPWGPGPSRTKNKEEIKADGNGNANVNFDWYVLQLLFKLVWPHLAQPHLASSKYSCRFPLPVTQMQTSGMNAEHEML